MAHSNRTDPEASVSRALRFAEENQPSVSRAVGLASDATKTDSTPAAMPVGREPRTGFLEQISGVVGDVSEAVVGGAKETAERLPELPLAIARGFLALPAGAERALHAGVEQLTGEEIDPIVEVGGVEIATRPFQTLVAQTQHSQQIVQEYFGNDESTLVNLTGEIVGGYATADKLFRSVSFVNKFVAAQKGPALFRPLVSETASANALRSLSAAEQRVWSRFVGGTLSTGETIAGQAGKAGKLAERLARTGVASLEGGLFMAGLPDTDKQDIALGLVAGLGLQGGAEIIGAGFNRFVASKATKAFPERAEEIRQIARAGGDLEIEGFPEFLARIDSNLQLGSQYGQTSDEAVASIRATLSERGETGAIGAVRGMTELDDASLESLRRAFPNYRFEVVEDVAGDLVGDQKLLFGLQPGTRLPEGSRTAPSLTDKVIDDFREVGLLRDQRVLVDGVEHRFRSASAEGNRVLVQGLDGGKPFAVDRSRIARLDTADGLLRNDRLLEQFRQFKVAENFDSEDRAFRAFADQFLEDMDPALRPHLRRYFAEQEMRRLAGQLRPDESAAIQQFRSARRELAESAAERPENIQQLAAQRAHVAHELDDGRVILTNLLTGETTPPFRNSFRAGRYLKELDVRQPDVAPSIAGVPDEMLNGMLVPHPRPNPAHPSKAELESVSIMERIKEAPEAFGQWWALHASRLVKSMEDAARTMERADVIDTPIWSEAMQPLSRDLRVVQNRTVPFAERLARLTRGLDEEQQDLIKGWLRSERKEVFEARHSMPNGLVRRAEEWRIWFDDLFDEFSASSGVDLSAEDYFRNYAPDWVDYASKTGRNDFDELWRRTRDEPVPNEVEFFAEMWKSGEGALLPQEPLASQSARILRSGMFKAHAGESFDRAIQFAKALDNDDIAKRHLIQYLNGSRGRIDFVRQRMDEVFGDLMNRLGIQSKDSRNLIDAMIDQTYGGTIAFRPALVLRNLTQPYNLLGPIMGNARTFRAQLDALKPEHRAWARRVGILEERPPLTFFEEFSEEAGIGVASIFRANRRARNLGLKPYAGADRHNRVTAALATKRKLEPQLRRFQAGEINQTELLEESGLWIMDQPQRALFFEILEGSRTRGTVGADPFERAVNFAADEVGSKFTNFLYGARNAHQWLRSTPGRAVGAYSTWPRGYLNWITQLASADVRTGVKLKALAKHGTFNTAVAAAGASAGVGLGSWVAWNSIFFGGSPILDVLEDVRTVWAGLPWEREEAARGLASRAPALFLPGGQLFTGDIPPAIERLNDGETGRAAAEALGFSLREGVSVQEQIVPGPLSNLVDQDSDSGPSGLPIR